MSNPYCWPGTKIPKSQGNAFTTAYGNSDTVDTLRKATIAAEVGRKAAQTKHARGDETMPPLPLKGSTPVKRKKALEPQP